MSAATVNLTTYTDADFAQAFRQQIGTDTYYDFTDCELEMMVRRSAEDHEVFLSLTSTLIGIPAGMSGIYIYEPSPGDDLTAFSIVIARSDLAKIPAGEYIHSLIVVRPDGLHDDLWRGKLTHSIGPTR